MTSTTPGTVRSATDCRDGELHEATLRAEWEDIAPPPLGASLDHLVFAPHALIYHEGSAAHGMFLIHSGMVKLSRLTSDGRQRTVRVLRPGDVLGLELLVMDHYDAEASAMAGVSLCRVPVQVMRTLDRTSDKVHTALALQWRKSLRAADDWLTDLNFGCAKHRVSHFITLMQDATDSPLVTLLPHQEMAAMMDMKRETVSREVSRLRRDGVIRPVGKHSRRYQIIQPEQLRSA